MSKQICRKLIRRNFLGSPLTDGHDLFSQLNMGLQRCPVEQILIQSDEANLRAPVVVRKYWRIVLDWPQQRLVRARVLIGG